MTARPSAVITGASRGIGYGIAAHLAALGWDLTLTARDAARLAEIGDAFSVGGSTIQLVPGDVADEVTLDAVVDAHREAFTSMNALVLAAGVGSAGPIDGYPLRRLDKQLAVNFRAPFGMVARSLPLLRLAAEVDPEHGGKIIALASLEGLHAELGLAAYGATKAALIALVASINHEEGANGVSATAISPGFVDTDMSTWVADSIPPTEMITVDDIVKTVQYVLSVSANAVLPHIVINRRGGGAYHA
jgi:3-oxoacyl-[acyl-carrier protein] reductase